MEKRKSVKIGIPRANLLDAMLAHENGRVRIVENIAGKMRQFLKDVARDVRVALCRDKNVEARRGE